MRNLLSLLAVGWMAWTSPALGQEGQVFPRRVVIAYERAEGTRWQTGSVRSLLLDVIDQLPLGTELVVYEFAEGARQVAHTEALTLEHAKRIKDRIPITGDKASHVNFDVVLEDLRKWSDCPCAVVFATKGVSNPSQGHSFVDPLGLLLGTFPTGQGHALLVVGLGEEMAVRMAGFEPKGGVHFHRLDTRVHKPLILFDSFLFGDRVPPLTTGYPTPTSTQTTEESKDLSPTPTSTSSPLPTPTFTSTATFTPTSTQTKTPLPSPSATQTPVATNTWTPTATPTLTPTLTRSPTSTPTETVADSATPTTRLTETPTVPPSPTATPSQASLPVGGVISSAEPTGDSGPPSPLIPLVFGSLGLGAAGYGVYRHLLRRRIRESTLPFEDENLLRVFELRVLTEDGDEISHHEIPVNGQAETLSVGSNPGCSFYVPEAQTTLQIRLLPDGRLEKREGRTWVETYPGDPLPLGKDLNLTWSLDLRAMEETEVQGS